MANALQQFNLDDGHQTGQNQFVLYALIREKKALRYTPGGVAVQELVLSHTSEQTTAGTPRKLDFECVAIAYADIAEKLETLPMHASGLFEGYLAPQYGARSRWMLHINCFTSLDSDPDVHTQQIEGVIKHGIC